MQQLHNMPLATRLTNSVDKLFVPVSHSTDWDLHCVQLIHEKAP